MNKEEMLLKLSDRLTNMATFKGLEDAYWTNVYEYLDDMSYEEIEDMYNDVEANNVPEPSEWERFKPEFSRLFEKYQAEIEVDFCYDGCKFSSLIFTLNRNPEEKHEFTSLFLNHESIKGHDYRSY